MKKPLLKFRMNTRPNFSRGQLVSFAAKYDTICPCAIVSAPRLSKGSPAERRLPAAEGIFLPDDLCEWLTSKLEVNAVLQTSLYGNFPYSLDGSSNLSLLDREEKAMKDSGLLKPEAFQAQLATGLNEVRFIRPRDNASIRKLREDLRLIDQTGLRRRVTILMPIHELANTKTFLSTSQSLLLKPGYANVTQVLLLDGQRITFSNGSSRTTSLLRLAVLTVSSETSGGNLSSPIVKTGDRAPGVTYASQSLWLKKHSAQSIKFLLQKRRAKEILSRLRPVARVAMEGHSMDRHFVPVVATFDSATEADSVVTSVSASQQPVFMAPNFDFYYGDLGVYNVITTCETPASYLYTTLDAKWVYPISHTCYRVGTMMSWTELVQRLSFNSDRITRLSNDEGSCYEPADSDTDRGDPEESPDEVTLRFTGFPTCVSRRALIEALGTYVDEIWLETARFAPDGGALLVTVGSESTVIDKAGDEDGLETAFGPLLVNVTDLPSRSQNNLPDAKEEHQASFGRLLDFFGPVTERNSNERKEEEDEKERGTSETKQAEKKDRERERGEGREKNSGTGISPDSVVCPNWADDTNDTGSNSNDSDGIKERERKSEPFNSKTGLDSGGMATPQPKNSSQNSQDSCFVPDTQNTSPNSQSQKPTVLNNATQPDSPKHTSHETISTRIVEAVEKHLPADSPVLPSAVQDELAGMEDSVLIDLLSSPAAIRNEILGIVEMLSENVCTTEENSPRSSYSDSDRERLMINVANSSHTTLDSFDEGPQVTLRTHDQKIQVLPPSSLTATETDTQTWADLADDRESVDKAARSRSSENDPEESSSPDRKKIRVQPTKTSDASGAGRQ
jgi:hypothetical protein